MRSSERAGAKRHTAAGGGERCVAEVKKQGALRSAPSEQGDYVSEGQLQVLLPLPKPDINFDTMRIEVGVRFFCSNISTQRRLSRLYRCAKIGIERT